MKSSFFDLSPDLLCILDGDGNFLEVNPIWQKELGWTSDELLTTSVLEKIPKSERGNFEDIFRSLREKNVSLRFDGSFLHKSGAERYLFWSGSFDPVSGSLILSARDKTEQHRNSLQIENSKQQMEAMFWSMKEGVCTQDHDGTILQFNEAALEMLGVTAEQMMGRTCYHPGWRLISADGSTLTADNTPSVMALATGEYQVNNKVGVCRPDGGMRWISIAAVPLFRAGQARPYQVVVTMHDNTIEETSRDRLQHKEQELSRVMNSLPAMVGIWDRNLNNILANQAYSDVYATSPEKLKGRHVQNIIGAERFQKNVGYMNGALDGHIQTFEDEIGNANGEVHQMFMTYIPDRMNGEVVGFISVATDVTRLKMLEKERRDFESKFVAASKMSALGEMAAGIAHEINNPLAIINGKTSLLQSRIERDMYDPVKFTNDLKQIGGTVERIAKTVRGLLSFSRNSETEELTPLGIQSIVEGTLDLCREKMRNRGVELHLDLGTPVEVPCRSHQISQILMNLLNNSNDAVSGQVNAWIAVNIATTPTMVQIRISDSGEAIPNDIAEKLMNPFFTTKEIGKGTGLGLSISKGLAENHGGSLTLDRTAANTTFVLELPLISNTKLAS